MHQEKPLTALPIPTRLRATTMVSTKDVVIAMVDSDFMAHPDLTQPVNRIIKYVDAVQKTELEHPPAVARDRHWHGTMTACTAAGNGCLSRGVYTSLAPDARLVLVRTMQEDGRIPTSTITWALQWIAENASRYGIRIVNISVYADELDQTLAHPVNAAVESLVRQGIVVVAAAGNNPLAPIRPPAAAPSAITVGGLNDNNTVRTDDNVMYHSTFGITDLGVQKPDVIAPALWLAGPLMPGTAQQRRASALFALDAMSDDMLETSATRLLDSADLKGAMWDTKNASLLRNAIDETMRHEQLVAPYYKLVDGTSFAAPIVTSIVAQLLACNPSLSVAAIKKILAETARPLSEVAPNRQGAGVVDLPAAMSQAAG
ncbi:MAG: serine protease [Candidatus Kapabacteria bacterium]|nr:serine protease [Candidatus Kapabacteria bacterium]